MGYGFADVEAALAELHLIVEDRRSAFSNRLKHFQRLGFPPGLNTGRGRAATYYAEHVFLLGVILQLSELSVPPERAINIIQGSFPQLAGGARLAIACPDQAILCETPTVTFSDLVHNDQMSEFMGLTTIDPEFAAKRLELMLAVDAPLRWSVFSLSGLITRLSELLAGKLKADGFPDFKSRLDAWASEVGGEENVWRGKDLDG